jgi:hypothetical protein
VHHLNQIISSETRQLLGADALDCKDGCSALIAAITRRKYLLARKLLNHIPHLARSVTSQHQQYQQQQQQQLQLPPSSSPLHACAAACQCGWAPYDCMYATRPLAPHTPHHLPAIYPMQSLTIVTGAPSIKL